MQIDRIEETRLSGGDEAAIISLLGRSFGTDFGGRSFYMQRHHVRLVLRDPQIVGHMALSLRAIRLGDALVDIVGLAEVATDPDRRGEGIATRLMDAAIAEARATGADFFVLFGDQPLYAASGFVARSNTLRFVELDGARTGQVQEAKRGGLMVLPLGVVAWDSDAPVDLLGHLF
ncbi:GNAT family N-acetyltransferase [Roseisalinus antarcticus]|uniref:Acetyltransferase (GNAT) family protein n=1 Tax=Roseisalinus antarcticus TaxID=254357 RepID=A0A1Y5TFZ2_9RHOB|nr:GNAT family N-acetyltransferase [Roseisalinus antarcticus]SLN63334.1 Acetyltransferase (GNAT) family protein [Roseisalinus antarcticus]